MTINIKSQTVTVNFEEYEGDTLEMLFNYLTDELPEGTPIDMANYSGRCHIRTSIESEEIVEEPTVSLVQELRYNIAVVTDTLPVGSYVYDIELTDGGGRVNTPVTGKIKIKQSITRG
jgi:hypothetical protein